MMAAAGAVGDKTYVDDIFSTYLWKGTGSARSINTGVDMTEGGLTWIRRRNQATDHYLYDTASGATKYLASNDNMAQQTDTATLTAFNNNGFSLGTNGGVNGNGNDFVGWSFRKAPGFFDVVTYTGTGSARTVAHSLGCVPGMVLIKKLNGAENWNVWHRSLPLRDGYDYTRQKLELNTGTPAANLGGNTTWNDTKPSATNITLGTNSEVNGNNDTYVAYFFAGGESTAATARSVEFDGTGDVLTLASSSDFNFGTGDFTFEGWLKPNNNTDFQIFLNWGSDNPSIGISNDSNSYIYYNSTVNTKIAGIAAVGQWTHYAISRSSGTTRLFLNGELKNSFSDSHNYGAQALSIGAYSNANFSWNGLISNVRIVKGTAVYTSSFKPTYEPLTNITNTKLLCCNNSSVTGSTVTPGTITANGDPTASTDSPFDDPSDAVFGENGDQRVIKCGSWTGSGSAGLEVNVGFEPAWILFKDAEADENWNIFDSMRGIDTHSTSSGDKVLSPNSSTAEQAVDVLNITPTGFELTSGSGGWNANGRTHIYMCIRRSDGYVGKPPELGTGVFAMDTGNDSSTIPCFDSNFAVDLGIYREFASTDDWLTTSRLTGTKFLKTNDNSAESTQANNVFDSNVGFAKSQDSLRQAWMWKRHAGFDVVTYKGDDIVGRQISHNLSKIPEMIWIKNRDNSASNAHWRVYHKGLNGGTNPADKYLILNTSDAEQDSAAYFNDTEPTSTAFTVGSHISVNQNGSALIAMLFASVEGISKVGSYSGSSSDVVINLGFQPRFMIVKAYNSASGNQRWQVMDTVRGMAAGATATNRIYLDDSQAQQAGPYVTSVSSTGITLKTGYTYSNTNNYEYIYYAHS